MSGSGVELVTLWAGAGAGERLLPDRGGGLAVSDWVGLDVRVAMQVGA